MEEQEARKRAIEWSNKNLIKAYQYESGDFYIAMSRRGQVLGKNWGTPFPNVPIAICQQLNPEISQWQIRDKKGTWIDAKEDGTKYPEEIETI